MNNLEHNIIKKMYRYETKRTLRQFILELGAVVLTMAAGFIIGVALLNQILDAQITDLFDLFSEDTEIIRKYFWDVLDIIYAETPKDLLILFIVVLVLLIVSLLYMRKHWTNLRKKAKALYRYWFR